MERYRLRRLTDYQTHMWQQIAEDRSFTYEFNGEYRTEHDGKTGNFYGMHWTFNGAGIFKTKDKRYQLSWKKRLRLFR